RSLVFSPARAGNGAGRSVERFANRLLTLRRAKNLRAAQGFDENARLGNGGGTAADDAVSTRTLAGCDAEQFHRDHLIVEHRYQPAHRTNEHFSALAPVHALGPVERRDFLGKRLGENLGGGTAFARNRGGQVFALGSADLPELRDIHA